MITHKTDKNEGDEGDEGKCNQTHVPLHLRMVAYISIAFFLVTGNFLAVIGGFLGIACANHCFRRAEMNKKNSSGAYILGWCLGLFSGIIIGLGLLGVVAMVLSNT